MKSVWKVTCNYIADKYMYAVYRLLDTEETDHSGNREFTTDYMDSKAKAEAIAGRLNAQGDA